jgi:hypothetical protein
MTTLQKKQKYIHGSNMFGIILGIIIFIKYPAFQDS